jgi:hypothetical protein
MLLVVVENLVAGLAGYAKLAAHVRYTLAIQQPADKRRRSSTPNALSTASTPPAK